MLISAALGTVGIDEVWMIPTFHHAFGKELAAYEDRVEMCERLATPLGSRVVVSRLERELGGQSRTLPLLERLVELLPNAGFRLLIGADILAEAKSWYRWDDVVRLAPPLAFGRVGAGPTAVSVDLEPITLPDISSTEVRRRLGVGQSIESLLPASVVRYIVARRLYEAAS